MWNAGSVHVEAEAPVRTADVGGWTDTWFAGSGAVLNVAIGPGVRITIETDASVAADRVRLIALGTTSDEPAGVAERWRDLLLGALFVEVAGGNRVVVESGVPAGCGLGTSASVCVAAVAATNALAGRQQSPLEIAHRAHQIETSIGRQSGVQDHAAAAVGGVHLWNVNYPNFFPEDSISDAAVLQQLGRRLITVYLGAPHQSSTLHEMVIAELESGDPNGRLPLLAASARDAFECLKVGDLGGFGQTMVRAHEGTRSLHRDLVSDLADHVVTVAALSGAVGWKLNGAGGTGGSLAILAGPGERDAERLRSALESVDEVELVTARFASRGVTVSMASPMPEHL